MNLKGAVTVAFPACYASTKWPRNLSGLRCVKKEHEAKFFPALSMLSVCAYSPQVTNEPNCADVSYKVSSNMHSDLVCNQMYLYSPQILTFLRSRKVYSSPFGYTPLFPLLFSYLFMFMK